MTDFDAKFTFSKTNRRIPWGKSFVKYIIINVRTQVPNPKWKILIHSWLPTQWSMIESKLGGGLRVGNHFIVQLVHCCKCREVIWKPRAQKGETVKIREALNYLYDQWTRTNGIIQFWTYCTKQYPAGSPVNLFFIIFTPEMTSPIELKQFRM